MAGQAASASARAANAFVRIRGRQVLIAGAFFSDADTVELLAKNNCPVDLIVRLGPATSAAALEKCLGVAGVKVEYFTRGDRR